MDRGSCFVYVHIRLVIQQSVSYSLLGIELRTISYQLRSFNLAIETYLKHSITRRFVLGFTLLRSSLDCSFYTKKVSFTGE